MDIKDIRLKKGMSKEEVNELISEWIELEDDIYMGNAHAHNWVCKCGNIIEGRMWGTIRRRRSSESCVNCNRMPIINKHKYEIEKDGEYEYIKTLFTGDKLRNGKEVNKTTYVTIKHKYCENIYEVEARNFIDKNHRCTNCCGSYEKSFAYHIEQELGESLEKYWDFEKNDKYAKYINKYQNAIKGKVWIKCQEKDYHGSYEISCNNFIRGSRCIYCASKIIHPRDSFAQHHIDNTDPNFLKKYWDYKNNTLDPFEISKSTHTKVWIKCQNEEVNELNGLMKKDYHPSYEISCGHFTNGKRCSYCNPSASQNKVHKYDSFGYYHAHNTDKDFLEKYWDWNKNKVLPLSVSKNSTVKVWIKCQSKEINQLNGLRKDSYHGSYQIACSDFHSGKRCPYCGHNKTNHLDSFGYYNFDKAQSWHPDNEISPFRVARYSGQKYKFICETCGNEFDKLLSNISYFDQWCPECSMSEGEKIIAKWLMYNGIEYEYEKEYRGLVGVGKRNLSYDFYLQEHNLLIEFQGEQHEKFTRIFHETYNDFERQQEHDKRKREYAKKNGIKLLEIWEEDKSNIEEILNKEIINSNKLI